MKPFERKGQTKVDLCFLVSSHIQLTNHLTFVSSPMEQSTMGVACMCALGLVTEQRVGLGLPDTSLVTQTCVTGTWVLGNTTKPSIH